MRQLFMLLLSAPLGPFVTDDSFLRRIDRKKYMDNGIVAWEVFRPRHAEPSLSFTYRHTALKTERGLDVYHRKSVLPQSGDLPGICELTFHDLTVGLEPPLPPRGEQDPSDRDYGHLHCSTGVPKDEVQMEKMAKLATRNGVLRPYVRARKK